LISEGLFPGIEISLVLGQTLLLRFQPLRCETVLHLPLDLSLSFLFGLLLLAGNEKC
jgi:hypothetical protein